MTYPYELSVHQIYLIEPNVISNNPYYGPANHNDLTVCILDTQMTQMMLLVIQKLPFET